MATSSSGCSATRSPRCDYFRLAFALGCACLLHGCANPLAELMVSAPNRIRPVMTAKLPPSARQALGISQELRVSVGPPEATLAVSIVEPKELKTPRGTILVIHGIWNESIWMLGTAHMLAENGYRAVLVDLRGHGRSTGTKLTYGQQESADLSQIIDELERRQLVAGPLGVYGISYGAATSIQLAGRDPRIRAAVAVAPFSTMRDVVPDYTRTMLSGIDQMISEETLNDAVDEAGRKANFNPDMSNAIEAMRKTSAQVLICHGTDDWLVPPYHALRLYEAGADHASLYMVPKTGHVSIWFDPTGTVAEHTRDWFNQHLANDHAPSAGVARISDAGPIMPR